MELIFGEIPYKSDQVWHMEADIDRLRAATGWSPTVDMDTGLEMTVGWHRKQRIGALGSAGQSLEGRGHA
jgi:nucleoside-diphosphate-sugar epimerase